MLDLIAKAFSRTPSLPEKKHGPTGTVTLVFTDVKSSTALWEMDNKVMKASLKIHNQLMRDLLSKHDGYEVKTEGDAFMIAFSDPLKALMWAAEVGLSSDAPFLVGSYSALIRLP